MHTVDASSAPSVSLVENSASNLRVCNDSPVEGDRAMTYGRCSPACENDSTALFGTGMVKAAYSEIPSWKRILDISCILFSLPLWLPVVILLALWIKLASPGPILFRQERVGHHGRRFMILKFRTMKVN